MLPAVAPSPLTGSGEAPSLDNSLTNIQWLGSMSSNDLSPCSVKKEMEKENQTPRQEGAVEPIEEGPGPSSSTASWPKSFTERPPYSYMAMIQFAINSTERKRMTLKDIYSWIEDHFPYFKHVAKPGWKNSIRHNLSLHDMFVRETPANSKISFWTIHPEANRYLTLDQVFKVGVLYGTWGLGRAFPTPSLGTLGLGAVTASYLRALPPPWLRFPLERFFTFPGHGNIRCCSFTLHRGIRCSFGQKKRYLKLKPSQLLPQLISLPTHTFGVHLEGPVISL
uniref:Uncharacterized protein n=1 Tax=Sphaerodactylus townsendi TaxID=933632 RepID=A0ACB8E646_9SAUR